MKRAIPAPYPSPPRMRGPGATTRLSPLGSRVHGNDGQRIDLSGFISGRLSDKQGGCASRGRRNRAERDQEAFASTLAEVCSASITSAKVRWSGKVQFSPGRTSRARIAESGNNSGRAFFHLAKATLFAISRSLT